MIRIGYSLYQIEEVFLIEFLDYVKKNHLRIFHLQYKSSLYEFFIPTYQRVKLSKIDIPVHYIKTIGCLRYFFLIFHKSINLIGVFSFLFSLILCSFFIFSIRIDGPVLQINKQIKKELYHLGVSDFSLLKDSKGLNEILSQLKINFKDEVEYMNIYQTGSVFHVEYTKRKQDKLVKEKFKNLYAKKDGLIMRLDVKSGAIKVKRNDYVKKGELLVENTILSTQNESKIIPVEGKVYAYVFEEFEATLKNNQGDLSESFYFLLLNIRSQLPSDAVIDKENVLQFTRKRSTITLKMHYTLVEDIAVRGDINEKSH